MSAVPIQVISSRPPGAPQPTVSVAMITYNHEKFVAEAVQSVLAQQTDFPVELVVSDDYSTDGTRAILREWQSRHSDRIRLLLPERNLGAKPNFLQTLKACDGKYLALLEGDDYWTDPLKLQKQVRLLEEQPEYSACFARTIMMDEASARPRGWVPSEATVAKTFTTRDLLERNFIATASVIYRCPLDFEAFGPFMELPMGDWPLHLLASLRGPIGYLREPMAAYRIHAGGIWTGAQKITKLQAELRLYQLCKTALPSGFQPQIAQRIIKTHQLIALEQLRNRQRTPAMASAFQSLAAIPVSRVLELKWLFRRSLTLLLGACWLSPERLERLLK